MDRLMMISSDCHAGAPWYVYRKYLDPQYREDYDRWLSKVLPAGTDEAAMNSARPFQVDSVAPERRAQYIEAMEKSMGHLGNWDPTVRARELDREGIAGEVVFCDGSQKNYPPFGIGFVLREFKEQCSYEQRLAGCRAHNRWLAEFVQSNPGRHAGVAMVTMDHPEETATEIDWCRKNGLFGGILLPALQLGANGYESFWHHPRYEPVWAACEANDMPLTTHATAAGPDYGGLRSVGSIEGDLVSFRPFWFLLWGGIFERHPNLKFCPTESGGLTSLWFNGYFDRYLAKRRPEEAKSVFSLEPSAYWYRQCFVGASAHSSRAEIDKRHEIGIRNIMWGSDYPHPEGTWPVSRNSTRELFAGVPEDEARLMLGENCARVFGFDVKKMKAIAAQIGPSVEDILGPQPSGAGLSRTTSEAQAGR